MLKDKRDALELSVVESLLSPPLHENEKNTKLRSPKPRPSRCAKEPHPKSHGRSMAIPQKLQSQSQLVMHDV